jgi:hypothetical protein
VSDKPCDTCISFDPVLRGSNRGGHKDTAWGWCAKKSIYPIAEEPGQKFPVGVQRMTTGEGPSKPYIVARGQVITSCHEYEAKLGGVISKADLLRKLREQNGGIIPG